MTIKNPKFLKYSLLILALLLTLFPFLYLAQYNHPSADDFCYTVLVNNHGFWETQLFHYIEWTGRYMATILLTINPINYSELAFYKLLPIFLLLSFLISIYLFWKRLLPFSTVYEKAMLTTMVLFLFLIKTPNISEAFYWMAASITYQLASILSLVLFTVIIFQQQSKNRNQKILLTFLGGILCIAIVGLNETIMIIICIILSTWFFIRFFKEKFVNWHLLILLSITIIATIIVLLAPGNAERMSGKPLKFQLAFSLKGIVIASIYYIKRWILPTILVLLLFLPTLNIITGKLKSFFKLPPISVWHILGLFIYIYGFMLILFFPSYWTQAGAPPPRTVNPIYLLYILGSLGIAMALLIFLQQKSVSLKILSSPLFRIFFGFLLLGFLFKSPNNIKTAYEDLFTSSAKAYHFEMIERYRLIKRCESSTCIVPTLKNKPATIFAYDLGASNSDEIYYFNECIAEYFEKPEVKVVLDECEQ